MFNNNTFFLFGFGSSKLGPGDGSSLFRNCREVDIMESRGAIAKAINTEETRNFLSGVISELDTFKYF